MVVMVVTVVLVGPWGMVLLVNGNAVGKGDSDTGDGGDSHGHVGGSVVVMVFRVWWW